MIVKTLLSCLTIDTSLSSQIQIVSTVFVSCKTQQNGGAVFTRNRNQNISFYYSSFYRCEAVGYGGGICIHESDRLWMNSLCFSECIAYSGPGYLVWGHFTNHVGFSHCNLTNENNPKQTNGASTMYSYNEINYNFNNVSSSNTIYANSNVIFGLSREGVCGRFSTFANGLGNGMIGFYPTAGSTSTCQTEQNNFVNCSHNANYGLILCYFNGNSIINQCIFVKCSISKFITFFDTYVGTCTISNCLFDFDYQNILSSNANVISCSFVSTPDWINHQVLNTNICWTHTPTIAQTLNVFPHSFTIPFLFYLII